MATVPSRSLNDPPLARRPPGSRGLTLTCAIGVALESLARNKTRAFLATLGIIIGVGCVITMLGLAQGTAKQMEEQIRSLGSNTVSIRNSSRRVGPVTLGADEGNALVLEDVDAILDQCPAVLRAAPDIDEHLRVEYQTRNNRIEVFGTTNDLFPIRNFKIVAGRDFLPTEIRRRARVCILGAEVKNELFGLYDPIDEQISINRQPYRVVGLLKPHGGSDTDWDSRVFVPVTTYVFRLMSQKKAEVEAIDVQAIDESHMAAAQDQIEAVLRRRHRLRPDQPNDFRIRNQQDLLDSAAQTSSVLTALLAGLASVSLLVGGIGIMNIMLVSVTERTREIGIRRAVGARKQDILAQFLIESLVMCTMGALLGMLAGYGLCWAAAVYANYPVIISPQSVLLSSGCAVTIGLFFGLYPAVRAAGLSPLSALRYD